ncbi:MAG: hypothetical protein HUJ26_13900 [Planctomycetaceae bacterium]|nr:hypothetical protein [Planctomycetaceae bacterium]
MSNSPSHDLISAYVDDRLSVEERAEVDALLESSPEARAELESYQKLSGLLKGLPTEEAPNDLASRVMAQAERESLHGKTIAQPASSTPSSSRRWIISTASLISAVAILFLAFRQFSPQDSENAEIAMSHADSTAEEADSNDLFFEAGEPVALEGTEMSGAKLAATLGATPDRLSMELGDNGLMKLIDPQDLKTAEIGDTVEGWQFQGDRVVVVQLTVVDREEVLNSMQILLSDLSIPAESGNADALKNENGDFYAVYVEADQEKMATALRELQEDMNIEEMLVSANLDSQNLNPYFAEQGYAWGISDGVASAEQGLVELKENLPALKLDGERESLTEQKSLADLPAPPPLPELTPAKSEMSLARLNSNRQVQLRLPEELGNQMIVQGAGLPSISNSFIQGDKVTRNQARAFKKELDQKSVPPAGVGGALERPSVKQRSVAKSPARPVQVLFLLAPESASRVKPADEPPKD